MSQHVALWKSHVSACVRFKLLEWLTRNGLESNTMTQPWFPLLMSMAIQVPLLLPVFPGLLSNPSGLVHPLLQDSSLKLVAWLVSGIDSWAQEFRRNLRASSSILAGKEHPRLTSQPGRGRVCGVVEGVWIPLHAL